MPSKLFVECTYPGCHNLVAGGRCPPHKHIDERGKTAARGYDNRWRTLSERYRRQHPFCEIRTHCNGDFCTDVDHIVPLAEAPHRRYDPTNLQSACRRCHNAKTRSQR